ncbi:hypothetical protein KAW55_04230 [bacterium]|nr:hypothetical protein [bacterium]
MLGFNRKDTIRKLILLITAVAIGVRCFSPANYYVTVKSTNVFRKYDKAARTDTGATVLHCIGIAIIGGMLFYILGDKKKGKD